MGLRLNYENEFFSKFVICSLLSEFIYANNQPALEAQETKTS